MNNKIYPESGIELTEFTSRHYDSIMNIGTLGKYKKFIEKAVSEIKIEPEDKILDLGCGTGRNSQMMAGYLNGKGRITGIDISENMEKQYKERMGNDTRIEFINQRIDVPFYLKKKYDKVLISFVLHGFPQEIRETIIRNAYDHLIPGGKLHILDYAEFRMEEMPCLHRFIFRKAECKYAFDYIEKDWKSILSDYGFGDFREHLYVKKYVRLLEAVKSGE